MQALPVNPPGPTVSSLTTFLANYLFQTLITDLAIEEHHVARRRAARRSNPRAVGGSAQANGFLVPPGLKNGVGQARNGTGNASPNKKDDALYDCLNCSRSVAASRYASHLAGCMGLGGAGGTRRGESRRAAAVAASASGSNGSSRGPASLPRFGSDRASSYASDEDSIESAGGRNIVKLFSASAQNKRSSSTPLSNPSKLKKQRQAAPTGLSISHPLSRTLSAPDHSPPIPALPRLQPQPQALPPPAQAVPPIATAPRPIIPPVRPLPLPISRPAPPVHAQSSDRPDSDSSDEDSAADERARANAVARQLPVGRVAHPLAKVVLDSDSGSDGSLSDGSGSD